MEETAERAAYLEQVRQDQAEMLAHYQKTGKVTTRMLTEATLAWCPFDWMVHFAPEWYRAGLQHKYRRPENFFEDLVAYEATVPKGEKPNAVGLIQFSWERWESHPWKPIWEDMQTLNALCAEFEAKVWSVWLQRYYQEAEKRGHSCTLDNLSMLVWGCAGRVMVTLQPHTQEEEGVECYLTFIVAERGSGSATMGVRGVYGTLEQARGLVTPFLERSEEAKHLTHPHEFVTHPVVALAN